MEFKCPYWSVTTKINMLSRWILVHSAIYYQFNRNVVSDAMFDSNSKQLADMIKHHRADFERSRYYYAMKDFDGSTGFGFVEKLNKEHHDLIMRDAHNLMFKFGG